MNWLQFRNILTIGISILVLMACERSKNIGLDLTAQQNVNTIYTELPVTASTILGKDLPTNTTIALNVGQYDDPVFGRVTAKSFFQIAPFVSVTLEKFDNKEQILDSLVFEFPYYNNYADTTKVQNFRLHRLIDAIDENIEYTNKSNLNFNPTPLFSLSTRGGRIISDGKIRFRIDNVNPTFATEIFNLLKTNPDKATFLNTLKGFVLVPGANDNAAIMGFGASNNPNIAPTHSRMICYYNAPQAQAGSPDIANRRTLEIFTNARFNQITSVRTGTPIETLSTPLNAMPSSAYRFQTFVQAGVNYLTKLSFPQLSSLLNQNTNISINRAELVIKILPGSADFYQAPNSIVLIETNDTNESLTTTNQVGTIIPKYVFPQGSTSPIIFYNSRDQEYRIPLTSYIQRLLKDSNNASANNSLIIRPAITAWEVSRMILANDNTKDYAMRLRVFYTKFD